MKLAVSITIILLINLVTASRKQSDLWKFVKKHGSGMQCVVESCNTLFKSQEITTIKKHLKAFHPTIWSEFEQSQKTITNKREFAHQEINDPKKAQDFRIALLVASPTIPLSLFENELFKNFLDNYDSRFKVPQSRGGVDSLLTKEYENTLERVKNEFKNSLSKISVVLDIWTTPGLKEAFIGGNGFFVDANYNLRQIFLGLEELPISNFFLCYLIFRTYS